MPFIVLGIDGLDYNLAVKWKLQGFLQKHYGTHDVSQIKPLYTPIIWCAFLIGDDPAKYGFSMNTIAQKRSFYGYHPVVRYLYLALRKVTKRKLGVRSVLAKLGLYSHKRVMSSSHEIENIAQESVRRLTVIEELKNRGYKVWVKDFPSYNDRVFSRVRADMSTLENRLKYLKMYRKYLHEYIDEVERNIDNYDVFFFYTPLIDMAEHTFYRNSLRDRVKLYKYYREVEKAVSRVLSKGYVLIVSDHGFDFKNATHSTRGFWSVNYEPPFIPQTVLDFKRFVITSVERLL